MNNKLHLVDTRSGQRLWLWWVLATSLPASLALIVLNWWLYLDVADNPQVALSDDNAVGSLISFGCGLLFIGLLVGVAQGWALHVGWWSNDWSMWILVDALGAVLVVLAALLLSMLTSGSGNGWIWIVVPGAVLGFVQTLALSPLTRRVAWWIPVSWFSWVVAGLVGALVIVVVRNVAKEVFHIQTQTFYNYPFYPPESAISWSAGYVVAAFVFAALTGVGLIWLLQQPRKFTAEN